MGKEESSLRQAFSPSLSLKGRGTGAKRQGEGVRGRGKTPDLLLARAKELRSKMTEAEEKLWSRLRASRLNGHKFRKQVPFSANYVADFVCPKAKLIVEADGSQHSDQAVYDAKRTRFFESQGYRVLRFWNNDILARTDAVLEVILAAIAEAPLPGAVAPVPLPLRERAIYLPLPQGERAGEQREPGEGI
jgi:very-short-patch-repair endonuclease